LITVLVQILSFPSIDDVKICPMTSCSLYDFQDGTVLLVRRLPDGQIGEENFKAEAAMLAKVKHRNLMVLRGCFINEDVRLLLYDYMPNGSLASLLQEASKQTSHVLDWPMRHLIALGIARGISFLHTECNPPIVHGDVKPNNVLFDADFEPHVSDFGLMALTTTPVDPTPSSSSVGSLGYVSPEANDSGELTRESDVYSFGIVLLELLTGRRPAVFNLQDEDIVKWVKRMLQLGEITEVFDPALLDLDPESSEWEEFLLAVKIALLCTAPDPADRPSIAEVVLMLEGCRTAPDVPSSNSPTAQTSPT
jgi:serine/threonine protein kinase